MCVAHRGGEGRGKGGSERRQREEKDVAYEGPKSDPLQYGAAPLRRILS